MKLILLLVFTSHFLPPSDGYPNPYGTMTVEDRGRLLKRCPIHNDNPIIKDGETCKAPYELLSSNADTFQCRKLCEEKSDCYFYVVEKSREKGKCYWEKPEIPKTLDKNKICSGKNEGWVAYNYIFYQALTSNWCGGKRIAKWKLADQ